MGGASGAVDVDSIADEETGCHGVHEEDGSMEEVDGVTSRGCVPSVGVTSMNDLGRRYVVGRKT